MRVEEEHDTMCSVWTLSSLIIISINNIAVLLKTGINLRCFFSFFFHKTYILLPDQRDRQYIMLVHDVINWESYVWCAYMYEWEIIAQIISEPRAICTNAPMCLLLHIFFCLVSQLKNNNICLNDFCFVYLPLYTEEERVLLCFVFFRSTYSDIYIGIFSSAKMYMSVILRNAFISCNNNCRKPNLCIRTHFDEREKFFQVHET